MASEAKGKRWLLPASALALPVTVGIFLVMRGIWQIPGVIQVAGISIHLYSTAIIAAILICVFVIDHLKRQDTKLVAADVWEGVLFVVIPAIIGARIYHVVTDFQLYQNNLVGILAIWNGGLGIIGGIIGGAAGAWWYCRRKRIPVLRALGVIAVVMPLGQAIGRLGNLFNHELFGLPTSLPWGEFVPIAYRPAVYAGSDYFQPLFLYEIVLNLLLFGILLWQWRKGRRGASLLVIYLSGYSVIRFVLDFMRIDGNSGIYGLSYAQWLIIGYWITIIAYLVGKQRLRRARTT